MSDLEPRQMLADVGALYGQYYDNANFTNLSFTRNDPAVGFDWQNRAPLTRMSADTFSVRWIGQVRSQDVGAYGFKVVSDGTVALRVRGQSVALSTQSDGSRLGSLNLPANQVVDLQVDYVHNTGSANIRLEWLPPSQAIPSAIPAERLINSFAPPANSFANPIDNAGQDPWVVQWRDEYIYVWSDGGRIFGSRAARLQDIGTAPAVQLYAPPPGTAYSNNVWAPELHRLDNSWFLYFAADNGTNANHRMFVAIRNADDPLAPYTFVGKIAPTTDRWAIDGTVLQLGGDRYFVWSGWQGTTDGQQDLYIARMNSPISITGERVRIATPDFGWERNGLPINEGPQIIQRDGATHIIYSGSGYWTDEYALGRLTLTGSNPMLASSWTKNASPVFSQANGIVGVGHASFVQSPDRSEDWIVYHAHRFAGPFNDDRVVRAQRFSFNGTTPVFGSPDASASQSEPSGTPTLFAPTPTLGSGLLPQAKRRGAAVDRMADVFA